MKNKVIKIKNGKIVSDENNEIDNIEELIKKIIAKINNDDENIINELVQSFANITTNEELETTIKNLLISLNIDEINLLIETKLHLLVSITVKRIVYQYYLNQIMKLDIDIINDIRYSKYNRVPLEEIIETSGLEIPSHITKLSKKAISDIIDTFHDELKQHLCWSCQKAYADKCSKIRKSLETDLITDFPFIKTGYQEMYYNYRTENNEDNFELNEDTKNKKEEWLTAKLSVYDCENFIPDEEIHIRKKKQKVKTLDITQ